MTRLFDLLISGIALVLLIPVFLVLSLLISLDSRGGTFFRQWRVGQHGKNFRLWKFRTMHIHPDADSRITIGNRDPRITRIGFWLRKYKLDELPQLINVLKSEMSMVGPRPELRKYVSMYTEGQQQVLQVKPGITDLASLMFSEESALLNDKPDPELFYIQKIIPLKIRLNKIYIHHPSLGNYCLIMIWTILKLMHIRPRRLKLCEALCLSWMTRPVVERPPSPVVYRDEAPIIDLIMK